MTIDVWVLLILFLLSNFTAIYMCFSERILSSKLERAEKEMDKLKEENADLRKELRRKDIVSILSKYTFGGK